MKTENRLQQAVANALKSLYGAEVSADSIQVTVTRKDQKGDYTVVVFPLLKISHKKPEETGAEIGAYMKANEPIVAETETIKGFLNLTLSNEFWAGVVDNAEADADYGYVRAGQGAPLVMIEYSSPNTNKPLHLGHIRNNLLGFSLSRLLEVCGNKVVKTNIVNNRGILPTYVGELPEICAAMNRTNINVQLLTIEAAHTHKKEAIYQAAMLDPHTSSELSIDDMISMCDDLFEAHKDWMPEYR